MVDYAFLRAREKGPVDPNTLCSAVERVVAGAKVTFAGHTDPFVVFVHCDSELTSDQRQAMADLVANAAAA